MSLINLKTNIPLLRKDFIIDPYQIFEARASGADAILLIATILETNLLADLRLLAEEYGMDSLVEVYSEKDLDRALEAGAKIIGVNNRDLKTFKVDIGNTEIKICLFKKNSTLIYRGLNITTKITTISIIVGISL